MLSNDTIRRGSFPDEYPAHPFGTRVKSSTQASASFGTSPPWLDIVNALTSNTWIAAADRELLLAHTQVTKARIDTPYRCAFSQLAGRFMVDWQDCHAHHLNESAKCTIPAELAVHCIDALAHISRYALHIDHVKSGEPWLVWSQRFSLGDKAANPWLRIAAEFPLLIHRLHHQYTSFIRFFDIFFSRLSADRIKLTKSLNIPPLTRISRLKPHFLQAHRNFRSGMDIVFENGAEVYYKPIPVDVEHAFSRLILLGGMNFLTPINVVQGTDYGWLSRQAGKTAGNDAVNFSNSVGATAACLWLLNASNVQNPVADNDRICAMDLDTLLTPSIKRHTANQEPSWRSHFVTSALQFYQQTRQTRRNPDDQLSDAAIRLCFQPKHLEFIFRSGCIQYLHAGKTRFPQASLLSDADAARVQTASVVQAFRRALHGVVPQLISDFADSLEPHCALRYCHRTFSTYENLLDYLSLPQMLRDSRITMRKLMQLHDCEPEGGAPGAGVHILIDDEIRQLLRGDIPYFSHRAGDTSLQMSDHVIDSFFSASGVDRVRAKVHEFKESDIDEQATLIGGELSGSAAELRVCLS